VSTDSTETVSFGSDVTPASVAPPIVPPGRDPTECNVTHSSAFPRVRVVVDESADPTEQHSGTVSVNGRMYQFIRGAEIALPPEAVEALEHATVVKVYQVTDGPDKGEIRTRPMQRFPFRILDEEGQRTMRHWREWHEQRRQAA